MLFYFISLLTVYPFALWRTYADWNLIGAYENIILYKKVLCMRLLVSTSVILRKFFSKTR